MYWVDNDKRAILESSFQSERPVSKIQQEVEASRKKHRQMHGDGLLKARQNGKELNS